MSEQYKKTLKEGGVGVMPTDTIYGIVGSALKENAVERIYKLRERNPKKPMLILISSLDDISQFGINLKEDERKILERIWPEKVTVALPCFSKSFKYLTRGGESLAFRMPKKTELLELLKETGPLVAPSANKEGLSPAKNIKEAKNYFGDEVDFYVDGGELTSKPSTIIQIENGHIKTIREGAWKSA